MFICRYKSIIFFNTWKKKSCAARGKSNPHHTPTSHTYKTLRHTHTHTLGRTHTHTHTILTICDMIPVWCCVKSMLIHDLRQPISDVFTVMSLKPHWEKAPPNTTIIYRECPQQFVVVVEGANVPIREDLFIPPFQRFMRNAWRRRHPAHILMFFIALWSAQ